MNLDRPSVLRALLLTVLIMFLLSMLWEFEGERLLCRALGLPYDSDFETAERWRFVFTSTAFAALSLLLPAILLMKLFGKLENSYLALLDAKRLAQSLSRLDPLTGLPNRAVFAEELHRALAKAKQQGKHCAVLIVDLNRFKIANGLYGHSSGDAVLRIVAERLTELAPAGSMVARVGGDEFGILLVGLGDETPPFDLAETIVASISRPISIAGTKFNIGGKIGIGVSGTHSDFDSLLRAADIALDRAKRSEDKQIDVFNEAMNSDLRARFELEHGLRDAVAAGVLRAYYQPLVSLKHGKVTGLELLARWPQGEEQIMPDVFIPLAEELGLIDDITDQILSQACNDSRAWPQDLSLALNISALQLGDPNFPFRILAILREHDFAPSRLEIEITESAVMANLAMAKRTLSLLRQMGIAIALDDFGTGYSSLAKLRAIPFDRIKIDRSFIRQMRISRDSRALVEAILNLASTLKLETTAEGIETKADAAWLAAHGCDTGQGYLFGKPAAAAGVPMLLRGNSIPPRLAIAS